MERRADLKPDRVIVIGVISDTHGLMRPEALAALQGSESILHAGDIGGAEILEQLKAIAPVVAVRGNVDKGAWSQALPETEVFEAGGVSVYILHDLTQLDLEPEAAGFQVVISGHSHVAKCESRNGVLFFNPGSAGPRRFKLPVSVGKLTLENGHARAEIAELNIID